MHEYYADFASDPDPDHNPQPDLTLLSVRLLRAERATEFCQMAFCRAHERGDIEQAMVWQIRVDQAQAAEDDALAAYKAACQAHR